MLESFPGFQIHVNGIVQGVGFRPFVYNLAISLGLKGWVRNTSSGVDIVVTGPQPRLDEFVRTLENNPPILSHIDEVIVNAVENLAFPDFKILDSQSYEGDFIPISPDVSICEDCRRELFDPSNRRYRYPFINCTNCGPRFSIIRDIPYDRPFTTMAEFAMCEDCASEYHTPSDRRYHAQPTACSVCGPQVVYKESGVPDVLAEEAIQAARKALKHGKILAVKGLGGYHLACDAANTEAVASLHQRKQRSEKPFALMSFDIEKIKKYVEVSETEEDLLDSPQHPIVLLKKKPHITGLEHTAPYQNHLGFMLPYTPLHLLLLEPEENYPEVFVMTSGNISEEPIAFLDDDAVKRLSSIADGFLTHNRPIHMRVDDSVLRVVEKSSYPIRRSRGYAPEPIKVHQNLSQILACGAELKNTFSLSRQHYIFVSHHIGDLENLETLQSFEEGISHFKNLFRVEPEAIAVDLHPDYLSTRYGEREAFHRDLPLIQVQHHHAHLAACLADNNIFTDEPVIGLIFDGTGYGNDGHIWGGEVLIGNYHSFERRFHLQETPLPGGDTAIRNPSKIALAHLFASNQAWTSDLPPVINYTPEELTILKQQLSSNINCPRTTSMGRLFDAVASLLGIRHQVTYEGQAAIELENICDPSENSSYEITSSGNQINSLDLYPQILSDMHAGIPVRRISARFHNAIAHCCLTTCATIRSETRINKVALSGGVWQNTTLLKKSLFLLRNAGFEVLIHHRIPTNDGGIAIGQILIASTVMQNK